MQVTMLKSKIHRATVTEANLNYAGSLTIDPVLMEAADMLPCEQVHVFNITAGTRFTTYIIEGQERGNGEICINGAAARLGQPGDLIIALTFAQMDRDEIGQHVPLVVHVDGDNRIVNVETHEELKRISTHS